MGKLGEQRCVHLAGEVAQSVAQGQFLFLGSEYVLALGRMIDVGVVGLRLGQHLGDAGAHVGLKFL